MSTLRLCFSPTTMQGDIYALAHYYQKRIEAGDDVEMVIGIDDVERYRSEPFQRRIPFAVPLWDRSAFLFERRVKAFDPHFLFVDNHLPKRRIFQNLVYLWHGFGWKEQRADIEFESVHRELKKLVGPVTEPNPAFVHQCYGSFEREHRVQFTRFAPQNCHVMGMLYADLLLDPPVTRDRIAEHYPFGPAKRRTVLLGFTWGFGEVFEHWDVDEAVLMDRLLAFLAERQANVIFRLHDRGRYSQKYLALLEGAAKRYGNVLLKYKDVERDNLFDVLMSDVVVSNFSGIVVYPYFTGAASVHIHPFGTGGEGPAYRFRGGRAAVDTRASYQWKMSPEENGGLLARTADELFEHLGSALDDPTCCRERSRRFIETYMESSTGRCCAELDRTLRLWHETGRKPRFA